MYNVGPPNYKLVYKPIKYRYIYNKPQLLKLQTNLANELGHHIVVILKTKSPGCDVFRETQEKASVRSKKIPH